MSASDQHESWGRFALTVVMHCLSAAEHMNETGWADWARPLRTRTETPNTTAAVANVAAVRRFNLTDPIIGDASNVHLSLVRGFTWPVPYRRRRPQGFAPARCLLFHR